MQPVMLKGRSDGLVLHLDDQCSFDELLQHVEEFVRSYKQKEKTPIHLHFGYRYCHEEQIEQLLDFLDKQSPFDVQTMDSYVISEAACRQRIEEQTTTKFIGIVRSGQEVTATGDLIVVGDVNPNGSVSAGGNIYVLGHLKGKAHAGMYGDEQTIIAASYMTPTHLAIAGVLELVTEDSHIQSQAKGLVCAYLNPTGFITTGKMHELRQTHPSLMTNKGGV